MSDTWAPPSILEFTDSELLHHVQLVIHLVILYILQLISGNKKGKNELLKALLFHCSQNIAIFTKNTDGYCMP